MKTIRTQVFRRRKALQGVTLLELLVVVAIIGILVLISLPNVYEIIQMTRIRTATNDLLIKIRAVRTLAIKSRRELRLYIDKDSQSLYVKKPGHTEYDLLKDIATAVAKGESLDDYVLYVEKSGDICLSSWDESRFEDESCQYYIGRNKDVNGVDNITFDDDAACSVIVINPSGTFRSTCTITLENTRLQRTHKVAIYKGGQLTSK